MCILMLIDPIFLIFTIETKIKSDAQIAVFPSLFPIRKYLKFGKPSFSPLSAPRRHMFIVP